MYGDGAITVSSYSVLYVDVAITVSSYRVLYRVSAITVSSYRVLYVNGTITVSSYRVLYRDGAITVSSYRVLYFDVVIKVSSYCVLDVDGQCARGLPHAGVHDVELHGIGPLRYVVCGGLHLHCRKKNPASTSVHTDCTQLSKTACLLRVSYSSQVHCFVP